MSKEYAINKINTEGHYVCQIYKQIKSKKNIPVYQKTEINFRENERG